MERSTPHYSDFIQYLRKFAPSHLIPILAAYSAQEDLMTSNAPLDVEVLRRRPPWAVSAMARESIVRGNENRSGVLSARDLRQLFYLHSQSHDENPNETIATLLSPIFYQQFYYQESEFPEITRAWALLGSEIPGVEPIAWDQVLGISLDRAINAALVLHALIVVRKGVFDRDQLDDGDMTEILRRMVAREDLESVASYFTQTPTEARAAANAAGPVPGYMWRHAFNPLLSKPLVTFGGSRAWAPQTALVSRAISPSNLFYAGLRLWGDSFPRELGKRTEAYVGMQLDLIASTLVSEIAYKTRQGEKKTVDWIWITPAAIVLVEVKSARMTATALTNPAKLDELVDRHLRHARDQIDTTASLLSSHHPAVRMVPTDRRVVGLAVTAEPFYLANSDLPEYGASKQVPSMVVSLRELEQLVTMPEDDAVSHLLSVLDDPVLRTQALSTTMPVVEGRKNPILDAAWSHFRGTLDELADAQSGAESVDDAAS